MTDDVNVTRAVVAQHAELVVDAAEIGDAKSGNLVVVGVVAGQDRQLGWRFSGFGVGSDDVRHLDVGVRQVKDRGQLLDIQDKSFAVKCPPPIFI